MTRKYPQRLVATIMALLLSCIAHADDPLPQTKEAIYNRPFILNNGASNTAIGGYLEANSNYASTNGLSEGMSFEFRRFNVFLYSSLHPRIKFISELEFEHGTEEISLETALIDFIVSPALTFRAGILLTPLGGFNQNHDSPRWEFIDRPLVSTQIIPSTLSEPGAGVRGSFYLPQIDLTYEAYGVNGLGSGVAFNNTGRTSLRAGKNQETFAEDNNGKPSFTGKISASNDLAGTLGLSYYGGPYNDFRREGDIVEVERDLHIYAADYHGEFPWFSVVGEAAYTDINLPKELRDMLGDKQWGCFGDLIVPVWSPNLLGTDGEVLNANLRFERVDYNIGNFTTTKKNKGNDATATVLGISYRPTTDLVIRLNYRHHWESDLLDNTPLVQSNNLQVGFATYF